MTPRRTPRSPGYRGSCHIANRIADVNSFLNTHTANLEVEDMTIAISTRNFTALTACLLLISACALPMEKLVNEALMTGDWSQVEKREDTALRRQARRHAVMCAEDQVGACAISGRLEKPICFCESRSDVMNALHQTQMSDYRDSFDSD